MKMKRTLLLAVVLSLFTVIFINVYAGNDDNKNITSGFGAKIVKDKEKTVGKSVIMQDIPVQQDDTVYCLSTKKEYLWQTPVRIIPKEEAIKGTFSIRLSNKNKAGYFCNLEILGKDFKPLGTGATMTISDFLPDSVVASSDILQSLSALHRINVIPDYTGKRVLQERFYDVNNNLLGYIIHQYDDIKANEIYFGPDGLPVKIAESASSPYGLRMNTVFDKQGNDSILFLTDGNVVVPDKYGAYYRQRVFTYDDKGDEIRITRSLDSGFVPVIDNSGKCGVYSILDRFQNDSIITFIDEHDDFITSPETPYDRSCNNVSSVRFTYDYDIYKLKSMEYFDIDGNPCQNIFGTHEVSVEYDSLCNESLRKGLDLDGHLSPIDDNGIAKYTVSWDTMGNVLEYHQYDINNKPVSRNGTNSSWYHQYDQNTGMLISNVGYIYDETSDSEVIGYRFQYSPTSDSLLYSDGSSKIVNYDTSGRETCIRFFNKSGEPDENTYCAVDSTQYILNASVNKSINREFYADGSLKSQAVFDSLLNTKTFFYYDEYGNKTDSYQFRFLDNGKLIGQTDCSELGIPCRAGGNSGVRYLHADVSMTLDGTFNTFTISDEFGEPDYLINSDGEIYALSGINEPRFGTRILRDEYGNEISGSDFEKLRDGLPKVMTVEVVDSTAYDLGFRDNDVILVYGDFSVNLEEIPTYYDFKRDWTLASILESGKISRMVVFRIEDAKNNKYGLVEINNLKGTPSELGIMAHIRYLTQKQKERILSAIESDKTSSHPAVSDADFGNNKISVGDNYVLLAYTDMFRTMRDKPYGKHVTDPAILLASCIKDRNLYWSIDDGEDTESFGCMLDSRKPGELRYPVMNFYFTTDMQGIKPICLWEQRACTNIFYARISDDDFATLKELSKVTSAKIDSIKAIPSPFDNKDLIACWQIQQKDSMDYGQPDGFINFSKNGKCEGQISNYGMIQFTEGNAIYRIEKDYSGNWQLCDSLIHVTPLSDDHIRLTCVDFIGGDKDFRDKTVAYLNTLCSTNKEYFLKEMSFLSSPWGDDLFIYSLGKDSLLIDNGYINPVAFTKINTKKAGKKSTVKTDVRKKKDGKTSLNSTLVGNWATKIHNPEASATMTLNEDGSMSFAISAVIVQELSDSISVAFNLDIKAGGVWEYSDDTIRLSNNPALMKIDMNLEILGAGEHEAEMLKSSLSKDLNFHKEEIAMGILKEGMLDGEISITELSDNSFMMNGNKWIRQ